MLNREQTPSFSDMLKHSGASGALWTEVESFLRDNCDNLQTVVRFPYGGSYGWGVKYSCGARHICDIFAETDAFTVFFRISNKDVDGVKDGLDEYAAKMCGEKYPCGDGGWVHYRVAERKHLAGVIKLLAAKVKPKNKDGKNNGQ